MVLWWTICEGMSRAHPNSEICYATSMRYLGIDYGTKRVGVALSDAAGRMAFPHEVLANTDNLFAQLITIIDTHDVAEIVIGHSLGRDAAPNAVQAEINTLIEDLTLHCDLPVHLQPEHYTTQAALRIQGRNEKTDASAAALILDAFLQSKTLS